MERVLKDTRNRKREETQGRDTEEVGGVEDG